jgi:hypothetical protein
MTLFKPADTSADMPCFPNKSSFAQVTFYWKMADQGGLEFDLIPLGAKDDIDFVLYKLDESNLSCEAWNPIRCMAEGPDLIDAEKWIPCVGITGLSTSSLEVETLYGCKLPSTNFLSNVDYLSEDIYALKVMNYTSFDGFILNFRNNPKFQSADQFPLEAVNLDEFDSIIVQSNGCIKKLGTGLTQEEEVAGSQLVSLFPNPASNSLNISTQDVQIISYRIIDQTGKLLANSKVDGEIKFQVPIHSLLSGIYLIDLKTQDGGNVLRRFVKL